MSGKKTEFPTRIKSVREAPPFMNKARFAQALGVTHPLVSQCEGGRKIPSTDLLVRLGNVAAQKELHAEAEWFWAKAGVDSGAMARTTLALLRKSEAPVTRGLMTMVPPSKLVESEASKGRLVLFPTYLLPNPLASSFVLVPDDSLLPMFRRGDVIIVDESESNLWNMAGAHVVAFRRTSLAQHVLASRDKLTDEEFARIFPLIPQRPGLHAGWLRSVHREGSRVLTLESPGAIGGTVSETLAIELAPIQGGSIKRRIEVPTFNTVGRVVAWIDTRGRALPLQDEEPPKSRPVAGGRQRAKRKRS